MNYRCCAIADRMMTEAQNKKPNILFVYYNPDSTGSVVDRTLALVDHFSNRFSITCFVTGEGRVPSLLTDRGVPVINRRLHENDNPFCYVYHFLSFAWYLIKNRIRLIHFMDYVWWKPAEILAAKILNVPMITIIDFYRREAARKGFLRWLDMIVPNSHHTAKDFHDAGLIEKTRVIHNFLDLEPYEKARSIRSSLRALRR